MEKVIKSVKLPEVFKITQNAAMKKRIKEGTTTTPSSSPTSVEVHKPAAHNNNNNSPSNNNNNNPECNDLHSTPSKPNPNNASLSAADYIKLINIRTCKLLALCLVVAFSIYHGLLHLHYGVTPCKGLIVDGAFKGDLWQPWGCMMHSYKKADAERCFRYNGFYGRTNRFVFIGDSRIRQLYNALQRLLELGQGPLDEAAMTAEQNPVHHDLHWTDSEFDVKLDFFWTPKVGGEMIEAVKGLLSGSRPSIVVLGSATHSIKESNDSQEALMEYRQNLTALLPTLERLAGSGSKVLWMMQPQVNPNNLRPDRAAITKKSIYNYNSAAWSVLASRQESNLQIWSSVSSLAEENPHLMTDGIHFPTRTLVQTSMMLLNIHCNDNMNFRDGTCCKSSDRPTALQMAFFAIIVICICLASVDIIRRIFCFFRKRSRFYQPLTDRDDDLEEPQSAAAAGDLEPVEDKIPTSRKLFLFLINKPSSPSNDESHKWRNLLYALSRLGLVLIYIYVCDRTNYFMKENKHYTHMNFFIPVLYVFVVGLFFNDEVKSRRFLNRDQTDEWKGWMQLVILIYHMTGASRVVPIYMHIRVLVTSYVFLNAYGHFFFAWLKGDNSLYRYLQVLFRMNFLTIVLCLAMNKPYQEYYFVPLISFWFTLQYCMMAIPPKITAKSTESSQSHYFYLIIKILVVTGIISIFYMSEVFFEKVFLTRPWKALFVTADDDIREWWFRWKLDRYSMLYGFIFAFITALGQRFKLFDDSSGSLWPRLTSTVVFVVAFLGGFLGYFFFALYCGNKPECNEIHPYIAFAPIIAFILCRNVFGFLRSRYSSFFAWFGRISLELFISQYHIWLAADTAGVLVLMPNSPMINILLTSFIFTCAAHEISEVTSIVAPYFVPNDTKRLIRNSALFLLVMIPIGIHDGMI